MEMDGRSRGTVIVPRTSATSALPPARIPGYNPPPAGAAAVALGLALDGPRRIRHYATPRCGSELG